MGMGCGWFARLADALRDSFAWDADEPGRRS